jgi:DNA repair protein RadD
LVFSTGIQHALHIRDELRSHGISCERVTGETPLNERDRIVNAFKLGEIRCLTNDSVLTTGFDAPMVDMIALLRPTKSPGLYVQMVGRGSRVYDGKSDFLVLDFGGNAARHGPIDLITGRVKNGTGPAPMKTCPECDAVILAGLAVCPDCGYQFEMERERALHDAKAGTLPVLSEGVSDWLPVTKVAYIRHSKPGSPDSLRVDYYTGLTRYASWQCFEHGGFPSGKAARWWLQRAVAPAPLDVTEALKRCASIETPTAIKIQRDGRYWRVTAEKFSI